MSLHEIPNGSPSDSDGDDSLYGDVGEHIPSAIGRSRGSDDAQTADDDPRDPDGDTGRSTGDAQVSVQALEREDRSDEHDRASSVTTPSEVIRPAPLPEGEECETEDVPTTVELPSRMGRSRPERPVTPTGGALSDIALAACPNADDHRDSPVYDYDPCISQPSSFLGFDY